MKVIFFTHAKSLQVGWYAQLCSGKNNVSKIYFFLATPSNRIPTLSKK